MPTGYRRRPAIRQVSHPISRTSSTRRTTRYSRWIQTPNSFGSDSPSTEYDVSPISLIARPAPRKAVDIVRQRTKRSERAEVFGDGDGTPVANSGILTPETEYTKSKAFIYDVADDSKPRPQVHFAGVVSEVHTSPVSPDFTCRRRRDVPVGEDVIIPFPAFDPGYAPSSNYPNHQANERKSKKTESKPSASQTYCKPEPRTLGNFYDRAREIYHAGPKGEGQKIWKALQAHRKATHAKKLASSFEMVQKPRPQPEDTVKPPPAPRKNQALPRLPSEHERLYPISPTTYRESAYTGSIDTGLSAKPKGKESRFGSLKSLSLPLGASMSVQYDARDVEVDRDAPHPHIPRIQPAPRSRKEVEKSLDPRHVEREKSLPAIPPPVPVKENVRPQVSQAPARDAHSRPQRFPTLADVQKQKPNFDRKPLPNTTFDDMVPQPPAQQEHKEHKDGSWFNKHLRVPSHELNSTNMYPTKRQNKLKAKISSPHPLGAPRGQSHTANLAVQSGGVGGPAAAMSLPWKDGVMLQPGKKGKGNKKETPSRPIRPEGQAVEKKTHKPAHPWALVRSRTGVLEGASKYFHVRNQSNHRHSDASFACQGVHETIPGASYLHSPIVESHQSSRHASRERGPPPRPAYVEGEDMAVAPLFSGTRGGPRTENGNGEVREHSQLRDTGFYQPYDDVLQHYRLSHGSMYDEGNKF